MTPPGGAVPMVTLEDLGQRFDTFLIDQFGVLRDGTGPYPGAAEALAALKFSGKRIAILSNSGKRAAVNVKRLAGLGFAPQSYDAFVSSGEVAWDLLSRTMISQTVPAGAKCLLLARDDDRSAIEGLDLELTEDSACAQLVLISGSRGDAVSLDDYKRQLANPASRGVPCLCTNPDMVMLTASGLKFAAGAIADLYASLGGPVTWVGKPFGDIYRAALAALGNPDPARVVCIGDSIEHDIAGGATAGLATALVRSGIHAGASEDELAGLFTKHAARPDFALEAFTWTLSRQPGSR